MDRIGEPNPVVLMSRILPAREDSFGDFTAVGPPVVAGVRAANAQPAEPAAYCSPQRELWVSGQRTGKPADAGDIANIYAARIRGLEPREI